MNRLLILAPNWLGDAVMALPAILDVRRAARDLLIAVAARPSIAPLFGMVGDVNDVITLEPRQPSRDAAAWRKLGAELRDLQFEAALLLPNSFHAALMAARAGIPERWGYRTEWRGPLLTRGVDRAPSGLHQVEYYQQLVHALGFPNGPMVPRLEVSADLREAGARALSEGGWDGRAPLVALAPGAAYGGAKRWPAASFAELAQALAWDGVAVVIVGSGADAPAGRRITAALAPGASVFNLIGRTDLPALAGVLVNCRALVGNDSGATHLGAALGVSVTAIFGPTDERVAGLRGEVRLKTDAPYAADTTRQGRGLRLPPSDDRSADRFTSHVNLSHPVWCRPCMLRECPLDHGCMAGIGVDAVLAAARRTL
jgi:heptosyltransferase-2